MTFLASLVATAVVALPWRVATYNVAALSARDSDVRFTNIAATIKASGFPELIALQEIADDDGLADTGNTRAEMSLARLQEAIAHAGGPSYTATQFDPLNDSDGGPPGANIRCVLLINNAFHLDASEPLFAGDAAYNDTRKPLHARVTMHEAAVDIVVVHLSAAPYAKEKRAEQTQRLAAWMRTHDSDNAIVMGDFNAAGDELVWPTLQSAGLSDTAVQPLPTHESGQAFDHILIGRALESAQPAQVMPQTNASDHAMVWVPLQRRQGDVDGGCQYAPRAAGFAWWPLLLMVCKRCRRPARRRCGSAQTCGSIGI